MAVLQSLASFCSWLFLLGFEMWALGRGSPPTPGRPLPSPSRPLRCRPGEGLRGLQELKDPWVGPAL